MKEKEAVCRVKEAKRLRVIEEAIEKQLTLKKSCQYTWSFRKTGKKGS
ncbi:MAG: hypothetical protein QME07_02695 [bacterium]|nr:hypothetical protein [bacterium]